MLHPIDPVFITQEFGGNPAVYQQFGLKGHNGLDYRTKYPDSKTGKRAVRAPYWGTVTAIGDEKKAGYGKFIRIQFTDLSSCVLAHLDSVSIKVGDKVNPGDTIAISDNTGFSSAAHLHFGFRPANFDATNGFSGYVNQLPMMTSDLQAVLKLQPPMPPSDDFAKQFHGKILVAAQDRGRKWYVWDGLRYEIDKAPSFELRLQARPILPFLVFISNADLARIPIA